MKDRLFANTEIVSYFLWEATRHSSALDLWYCAEDIGFFLESMRLFDREQLDTIMLLPKNDSGYIEFVRHLAYRIHRFTMECDSVKNWFIAEKLLNHNEWISSCLVVSEMYSEIRNGNIDAAGMIRTEKFRKLFL